MRSKPSPEKGGEAPAPQSTRQARSSRVIEVDEALLTDIRRVLASKLERAPTDAEIEEAVGDWIDEEILVREAEILGIDHDDPVVRAHLSSKMAFVLQAREVAPVPTDAELRQLYAKVRGDYFLPAQITLRQYFFAGTSEAVKRRAEALKARAEAGEAKQQLSESSDKPPGGPVLRGRTLARLETLFGKDFADGLDEVTIGSWHLRQSPRGWHVVSVTKRRDAKQLSFEDAKTRVAARWQAERIQNASDGSLRELRKKYEVRGWPR